MILYRIRDWGRLFENNRTRELKRLEWIAVPNKHDSDGFTDLMSREDGPALYGAWVLILEVASKCEIRGVLSRSRRNPAPSCGNVPTDPAPSCGNVPTDPAPSCGNVPTDPAPSCGDGIPHTAATIARITRCPEKIIQRALNVCQELGWIELITEDLPESRHNPAPSCGKVPTDPALFRASRDARYVRAMEGTETHQHRKEHTNTGGNGTEGNGRGQEHTEAGAGRPFAIFAPSARFADWWQLWTAVKGTSNRTKAEAAYLETVPTVAELDCFECTASYLESLDNPARGYHPHNFLAEQAKEKFKARWPISTNGNRSEAQSLVERTLALMQSRIDKGQPPL